MARLKPYLLPASSLVEVLIAMVIILVVFGIAIGIFTNVTQSGYSLSSNSSQQHMQKIIDEAVSDRDWQEQQVTEDSIIYNKTVSAWPGYDDLLMIEVNAIQNGKELGTLRRIVRKEAEE